MNELALRCFIFGSSGHRPAGRTALRKHSIVLVGLVWLRRVWTVVDSNKLLILHAVFHSKAGLMDRNQVAKLPAAGADELHIEYQV